MTQAFVPLIPGAARAPELGGPARLKPISAAQTLEAAAANGAKSGGAEHAHKDPTITLERQGDTITHIRVECGCGQVIELKCEY